MSEIISPSRLTYSREFILKYSNHLKPDPSITEKLQPYLSPPYTKQAKKHPLASQRSPFGKKNFNTDLSPLDANSSRFGGDKTKSKTPNPRKADTLGTVQVQLQSEKKHFGRPKDVHSTFSPTQFRGKVPALNDSQKENVPASLNVNTIKVIPVKPKSPRALTAKQDPLKTLDNAVVSPKMPSAIRVNAAPYRPPARMPLTPKTAAPQQTDLQTTNGHVVAGLSVPGPWVTSPTPSVIITDEAPQECIKTPFSSPLVKAPSVVLNPPKIASPVHAVVKATPYASPQTPKDKPPAVSHLSPSPKTTGHQMTPFKSPQSTALSPGKSPKSPNRPISPLDEQRLLQRQKQIDYGYRTVGYLRYRLLVAKDQRKPDHPRTPKKTQGCSKRSWDGQLKKWRRDLHLWDPDNNDGFRAMLNSDFVVNMITASAELEEIVRIVREKMDNPSANPDDDYDILSPAGPTAASASSAADPAPPASIAAEATASIAAEATANPDGVNEKKISPSRIANDPKLHKVARTLVF